MAFWKFLQTTEERDHSQPLSFVLERDGELMQQPQIPLSPSLDLFTQPCVCVFLVSSCVTDRVSLQFCNRIFISFTNGSVFSLCPNARSLFEGKSIRSSTKEKQQQMKTWKSKWFSWGCPRARFRGWRKWNQHSGNKNSPAGRNQQAIKTGNEPTESEWTNLIHMN